LHRLSEQEIHDLLIKQADWRLEAGALVRDWKFRDFAEAMTFVNQVASVAEEAGHHPDVDIRYNRVRLALTTHDAGGITNLDIDMAKLIVLATTSNLTSSL
jgi:4a-hydroxytetrahydrobiopterin dehydratase